MTLSRLAVKKREGLPSPFSCSPDQGWEGNDGKWSTFIIRVGTPDQDFRVLISTAGQETWVPVPEGCLPTDPSNCGDLRGVEPFQSHYSSGFNVNASSTWVPVNLYQLGLDSNLNYTGNGEYGLDNVGLGLPNSGGPTLERQVVAGIATKDFLFGILALGPKPTNFTTFDNPQPSFMWSLRNRSIIPSLSFGYTAGAYYRGNSSVGSGTLASLTLGGYDSARFTSNNLTIPFSYTSANRLLVVGLQSIQASNSFLGVVSLLPTGIFSLIDSTVPEIWLPLEACTVFETAFGLQYDYTRNRYLVNDTTHTQLLKINPVFTFKIGTQTADGETVQITVPYAAFDLQASWPIYNSSTNYFPLRRAENSTQYTLGRSFLQETYLTVDYERANFSVSQCTFGANTPSNIKTIYPMNSTSSGTTENSKSSNHGLQKSALAGIIVAVVVVFLLLGTAAFLFYRKWRKTSARVEELTAQTKPLPPEVGGDDRGEMNARPPAFEVDVPKKQTIGLTEMDAGFVGHEIGGNVVRYELPTDRNPALGTWGVG